MEDGRELLGVPEGVALAVEVGLPNPIRDLRADDRGVILLFRDLGVRSSCGTVGAFGVEAATRGARTVCELLAEEEGVARRGAMGVFAVRFVASVGFRGLPGVFGFVRSMGMIRRGVSRSLEV